MDELYNTAKGLAYIGFIFLGIGVGVVKILFLLMMLDSILGSMKALRLGNKFSLKTLSWGIVIKLSILIIPVIIALMAKALSFDFKYFVIAVMDIIIVSEGISCITNIISIKTKKEIKNTDFITMLLYAIKRALTGIIRRSMKVLEEEKNDGKA